MPMCYSMSILNMILKHRIPVPFNDQEHLHPIPLDTQSWKSNNISDSPKKNKPNCFMKLNIKVMQVYLQLNLKGEIGVQFVENIWFLMKWWPWDIWKLRSDKEFSSWWSIYILQVSSSIIKEVATYKRQMINNPYKMSHYTCYYINYGPLAQKKVIKQRVHKLKLTELTSNMC